MTDSEFEHLCDRFEHAWSRGLSPQIEDFLPDDRSEGFDETFQALLEIELEYRFRDESKPTIDEYGSRFPEHPDIVERAFVEVSRRLQATVTCDVPATATVTNADLLAAAPPPQVVGQYEIIEQIGKGGMGQVFLAEQTAPIRRRVALKIIQPALLEAFSGVHSEMFRARFEAERQALAMMEHPNIARVYEAGVYEDSPFLAMEFIDGIPISQYCDEQGLDIGGRIRIFCQACRAVQHAHTKGVIHRDIKPQNVLVTEVDGQPSVKVIDFGLARASEEALRLTDNAVSTVAGAVLGTWAYMSPEQAQGQSGDVDTRSDVYSLGVLLYELLTGDTPLSSSALKDMDASQRIKAICENEPPIPSRRSRAAAVTSTRTEGRGSTSARFRSTLKGDLDWITMRAIEKQRDRRYQSPQELEADIARHLRDEPVLAGPPSWVYRLQKLAKRNPLGTVLLMLCGVLAITTFGLLYQRSEAEAARADQQAARAAEEAARAELVERNLVAQLTSSIQLLSRDTLDQRLASIDEALDSWNLTPESRAAVGLYKADLLTAVERFDEAYRTLKSIQPANPRQESSLLLRRMLAEDDPTVRSELRVRLGELSDYLTGADRLFLEAIKLRQPRQQIRYLQDALMADPAHIQSRYQLGMAYCLTGQTEELRRLCEISRVVYPASPFFDILLGFGAAFNGDRVELDAALARLGVKSDLDDARKVGSVMEMILKVSGEIRELEDGMPNSLNPRSLISTLGELQKIDLTSPTIRYLARQLSVARDDGPELPASSVLLTRWIGATAQFTFGNRNAYESLLTEIEAVSPIPGDAIFSYARSILAFDKENWIERIARQERLLEQPSVIPALKSEVTYVLHMSRRGLYQQTKDPTALDAAVDTLKSWLRRNPKWDRDRLKVAVDTALAAKDVALAERILLLAQEKIAASDTAVLECQLRIHMKEQAYNPAVRLAGEILDDETLAADHPLRELATKLREKALSEIRKIATESE